jgi:hypothetical protein
MKDGGEIKKCLQEFKEEQQKIKIIKSKKKNPPVLSRTGGFQAVEAPRFQDNRHMKMVGCQHYTPAAFTPQKYTWYSFILKAEATPGTQRGRKDYVNEKSQYHHRESNPQPSGL